MKVLVIDDGPSSVSRAIQKLLEGNMGYRLEQSTDETDMTPAILDADDQRQEAARPADEDVPPSYLPRFPGLEEFDREFERVLARVQHPTEGQKVLLGMLHLGNAFRFIEKLYAEGAIDFITRKKAGNLICDLYEDLREDAFIYSFSRDNRRNEGCL
jgi:hypothetical protein